MSDEESWREMARMLDLLGLVERCGRRLAARLGEPYNYKRHPGYPEIEPEEWARWDAANVEFQARRPRRP